MHAQPERLRAVPRTRGEQQDMVNGSHEKALIRSGEAMREHENSTPKSIEKLANSTSLAPHPAVRWLSRRAELDIDCAADQAVLTHGREFKGVVRPKGYRLRALKQCFVNAGDLALRERGTYVEGFAICPGVGIPVHHAWLTLDGTDAIEVTWRDRASECHYFGISFSNEVLEPIRKVWIHDEGFATSRFSMMRIMARRMKAATVLA
jgi:hypothetical protein